MCLFAYPFLFICKKWWVVNYVNSVCMCGMDVF